MRTKQLRGIANGEVDKLKQIKTCRGHEWEGPSQEVAWGDSTKHLYHCKYCPLAKLFDKEN